MSGSSQSPCRRLHASSPDAALQRHGQGQRHGHSRSDNSSSEVFSGHWATGAQHESMRSTPPLLEPLRASSPEGYAAPSYSIGSARAFLAGSSSRALAPTPGSQVAADPEGRFVWTITGGGSMQQQLFRAGGNPAAKIAGASGGNGPKGGDASKL